MGDHSRGWLSTMSLLTAALFVTTLRYSWALSRTDCSAVEPEAEKAVDLINKGRWNGYLFQLLRVADAHLDTMGPATVYYLALDVRESDCWVLPRKKCEAASKRPSEMVIGQCKVIAKRYSKESQDFKVKDFNCTTSSVSSALSNTKDSPVLFDFFEDTEPYRPQAEKALDKYKKENEAFASFRVDQVARVIVAKGGERTNYYVDFSVRNCSAYQFHRSPNVFGFCRADLSYATEPSELETPKDLLVDCEVFNFEDHKNISDLPHHGGHHHHFGPHGPPPHGHPPHGHPPHGPPPHGHHPHGPPPHGHHPHGHPPHGPPPHRHHPHGHGFHDFGPCDPPQDYQGPKDHQHHGHDHGHGPSHRHAGEKEPGKGHFRFHRRKSGHIVRLPPLKVGEVLPLPEANFPRFLLPFHNYSIPPEFQPFPQSTLPSASCPGKFKSELPTQLEDFFAYKSSK